MTTWLVRCPTFTSYLMVPSGTRAGRVKVVFTLPRTLNIFGPQPAPAAWPRGPLAYIKWYTPLR